MSILFAALFSATLFYFYPATWILNLVIVLGFLLPIIVLGCILLVGNGTRIVDIPSLHRIQKQLHKDDEAHRRVTEVFLLVMFQIVALMVYPTFLLNSFIGFGAMFVSHNLLRYMNQQYGEDFDEAIKYFNDDNTPTGGT